MATAYMRREGNEWVTDVYNSHGVFVKTVPTHPSQIREKKCFLWKPSKASEAVKSLENTQEIAQDYLDRRERRELSK